MPDIEHLGSDADGAALAVAFGDAVSVCEPNVNALVAGAVDRSRRARRHRVAGQIAGSAFLVAAVGTGAAFLSGGGGVHPAEPGSGRTPTTPAKPDMDPTGPAQLGRDKTGPVLLSLIPPGVKALPDPDMRNNDVIVGDGGTRSATLLPILSQNANSGLRPMLRSPADLDCAKVHLRQPEAYCKVETLSNGDTVQVWGGPSQKYPGEIIYSATLLNPAGGYLVLTEDLVAPAGTPLPITADQLVAIVESPKWTPLF